MHDVTLFWDHRGTTTGPPNIDAQLQPRNQALGVPQSGRHDSKPEGSRLTTNAITGLKSPETLRRDRSRLRWGQAGHAERSEALALSVYWINKRQRLGLGHWPAVGPAEARARAQKARERLDEGIDPAQSRGS